jgi:hypothetical protein
MRGAGCREGSRRKPLGNESPSLERKGSDPHIPPEARRSRACPTEEVRRSQGKTRLRLGREEGERIFVSPASELRGREEGGPSLPATRTPALLCGGANGGRLHCARASLFYCGRVRACEPPLRPCFSHAGGGGKGDTTWPGVGERRGVWLQLSQASDVVGDVMAESNVTVKTT